jgi:hypothetical protein
MALPMAAMCIGERRRYLLAFVSVTSINVGFWLRVAVVALAQPMPDRGFIDIDTVALFALLWLAPLAANLFIAWLTYGR